ncbi:MAG: hypothetical protein ABIQ95_08520, partial [Bdellovibrionia bacterium]
YANSLTPANNNVLAWNGTAWAPLSLATIGGVTSVTATGLPIVIGGSASAPTVGINQSNTTTPGYLSSTDWNTFNAKQPAGNYLTALTGDVTASGPGSAAATVASVGGSTSVNINAATLLANAATNANTANTIVKRDALGNFTSGTITSAIVYDDTLQLPASTKTTVQTVLDWLKQGPLNLSVSASSSVTATTSYALLTSMTLTPTVAGDYQVLFTGDMSGSGVEDFVSIYVNGVQITSSIRSVVGPTSSRGAAISTSEVVTWSTGAIEIRWKGSSTSGRCDGRNLQITKVQ